MFVVIRATIYVLYRYLFCLQQIVYKVIQFLIQTIHQFMSDNYCVIIINNIQFSYMFRRLVLKNVVIRFNDAQSTRFLFKLLYLRP